MPYLQVDLDAMDAFGEVAIGAEIPEGDVSLGCLRMWRYCWKTKVTHVTRGRLATFFPGGASDKLISALEECHFIDRPPSRPDFHVRGSEKRLRVFEAQSEAGKKATGNLKHVGKTNGSSRGGAEVEPESTNGSGTALTSNIQHPASSSKRSVRAKKRDAPPDPRHGPLREAMKAVYREERRADLGWEAKEGGILSGLLAANPTLTPEAGAAAWRRALRHGGYPTVSTVAEFRQHIAHFLGAGPPSRAGGARVTEADKNWKDYEPKKTADGQVDWEAA